MPAFICCDWFSSPQVGAAMIRSAQPQVKDASLMVSAVSRSSSKGSQAEMINAGRFRVPFDNARSEPVAVQVVHIDGRLIDHLRIVHAAVVRVLG
jgi:hypothetical protein